MLLRKNQQYVGVVWYNGCWTGILLMLEHSPFDGSETYSLCVELEGTIILFGAEFDTRCTDIYIYTCLAFGVL